MGGVLNDLQWYLIHEFVEEYKAGLMSRRDMIRRVMYITGGVASTATILTSLGCGPQQAQPTAAPATKVAEKPATGVGAVPSPVPASPSPAAASPVATPLVPVSKPAGAPSPSPAAAASPSPAARSPLSVAENDPAIETAEITFTN
jgi:carboxymethylenebutenolidase